MSKTSLKSLDWTSLLNQNSSDEYDSDETVCDEKVYLNETIEDVLQNTHNSTGTKNIPNIALQANFKNVPVAFCPEKTLVQWEVNLNEGGGSGKLSNKSEMIFNCSDENRSKSSTTLTGVSCSPGHISDEVCESNAYLHSKTLLNVTDNSIDTSESTFGFSDIMSAPNNREDSLRVTHKSELSKQLAGQYFALKDLNKCIATSSESTFGFTDMSLCCVKGIEFKYETENEDEKSQVKQCLNGTMKERVLVEEANNVLDNHPQNIRGTFCSQSPIRLNYSSSVTPSEDYSSNKRDQCADIINGFVCANELVSKNRDNNIEEQSNFTKDTLNFGTSTSNFDPNVLESYDTDEILKKGVDFITLPSCSTLEQDAENNILQTRNSSLSISTESLVNFLGNDFIEEDFENIKSVHRQSTCSPPLTLVERSGMKSIKSGKNLSHRRRCKKDDIPEKVLPTRKCSSKYINHLKRCTDSDEKSESSYGSHDYMSTKTKGRNNENSDKKMSNLTGMRVGKTSKRKKLKASHNENSLQGSHNQKVSFFYHLRKTEAALHELEQKAMGWVSGEEDQHVSRENAFGMLMETQNIVKSLESFQVPKKNRGKFIDVKIKLCERARKLALAIDAAIAECDQMFRRECYEKLFEEKTCESLEDDKNDMAPYSDRINHPKYTICDDSRNTVYHITHEDINRRNSVKQQGEVEFRDELQKPNFHSAFKNNTNGSSSKESSIVDKTQKPYLISNLNPLVKNNIPKPILKNSTDSESSTEKTISSDRHISFSDDIEFRYLSGSSSSQLSTSERIILHKSQPRIKMKIYDNKNDVEKTIHCHLEESSDPIPNIHSKSTAQENIFSINKIRQNESLKFIGTKPQEMLHSKSIEDAFYVQASEIQKGEPGESVNKLSQKTSHDFQFQKTNIATKLQTTNHDFDDKTGTINIVDACDEKHSSSDLSYSENSTVSFGFTAELQPPKQLIWKDVSIMDIKYIRIKSPSEFTLVAEDDDKWLEDLGNW